MNSAVLGVLGFDVAGDCVFASGIDWAGEVSASPQVTAPEVMCAKPGKLAKKCSGTYAFRSLAVWAGVRLGPGSTIRWTWSLANPISLIVIAWNRAVFLRIVL